MNISDNLAPHFLFCTAAFLPFPDTYGYAEYQDEGSTYHEKFGPESADKDNGWRIDGATFGVEFNAFPQFLSPLPPSRIDVEIPDQMNWSSNVWSVLSARESACTVGQGARSLGISIHVQRALQHWSSGIPDFREQYHALPFGSRIVISNVEADITRMRIAFEPNFHQWRRMLSAGALKELWKHENLELPPSIDYRELEWEKQLGQDVCLVKLRQGDCDQMMVFKSQTGGMVEIYHEIKVFLTLPEHSFVAERPKYLVTTSNKQQQGSRVCGFLMKYYDRGTLFKVIPERHSAKLLTTQQRTTWAKELLSVFQHFLSNGSFYSDFRMDNVVVGTNEDGSERVVMIDLEQSRNLYNWVPPEIYYMEWLAELGYEDFDRSKKIPQEMRKQYSTTLERFLSTRDYPTPLRTPPAIYDNPPLGWYFPWLVSTPAEREAAQVYFLGKALYCLFEGIGEPELILGRAVPHEAEHRFPEFRLTPPPIQDLIKRCTAGARQWIGGHFKIYRHGGAIFPIAKTGVDGEEKASLEETKDAIKSFWQNEVLKAEAFIQARVNYEKQEANSHDVALLDYLRRPKLQEVLQDLELFERTSS